MGHGWFIIKEGDLVSFEGILIGYEELSENFSGKALVVHGSINGLNTIFYLFLNDVDRFLDRGIGVSIKGRGVVVSLNPIIIKGSEVV